jgi:serine/threonine-protein kinase
VYLAHDTKHNRKVALKVLKPELAAMIGAERFLKEIEVTANLQHPHILPLHDSGEASGFLYYVMPYVEGETLRAKLEREKQFAIDDAVELTRAIAGALDYAHRQGVIHRDIKPENILLVEGQPQVADFGIALAVSQAGGTRLTETGLSIGTPQYMSPEQAMGDRELDARSDVYSLGVMLYEMLTGDPPYMGSTAQAIVAKVITEHAPPVTATRDTVPPHVAASVDKALAKLPADRFTSAAQFGEALVTPGFTGLTVEAAAAGGPAPLANRRTTLALAGATALMTLLFIGSLLTRPTAEVPRVERQRISLFGGDTEGTAILFGVAVAPHGDAIVFSDTAGGTQQLWLKHQDRATATPLSGTEGGWSPFFSPDGQWIAFFADGKLRKTPRRGGSAITLSDSARGGIARGGAWLGDGTIVFNHGWSLYRVSETGGMAEELLAGADTAGFTRYVMGIQSIIGDRGVLFSGCNSSCGESETYVFDLQSREARQLVEETSMAWYAPSGHLIYVRRDGGVFAAPFDAESLTLTGAAVPVLGELRMTAFGFPDAALGADGTLLYVSGASLSGKAEVVWVDREGGAEPVDPGWIVEIVGNSGIALSPDGTKLAIAIKDENTDLWIKELDRGPLTRLTFDGDENTRPVWTPDSRSVRFISNRGGRNSVWTKRADGSDQAVEFEGLPDPVWEIVHSPEGELALIRVGSGGDGRDLLLVQEGDSTTVSLLSGEYDEFGATLSPDGEWLAYVSDESGSAEVYVRPFPDAGSSRRQLSKSGGREPLWSHSGREIFYVNGEGAMVASQVGTEQTFRVDGEVVLFPMGQDYRHDAVYRVYDVTQDDQRFVMMRVVESEGEEADLILVKNWFTEIEGILSGE